MDKKKAAIYIRVSTDKQEYERQLDALKKYAKFNDYEIAYIFKEKMSGLNSERPEYNRLISLTKENIDILLIWELSRLSRKSIEIQSDINRFTQNGINVYIYNRQLSTLDDNGNEMLSTKMIISMMAVMAEDEIKTYKQRSKSAKHFYVLSKGKSYTQKAPLGYDIRNKYLYVNNDQAKLVRRIFDMCISGDSQRSIAITFNSEGRKTLKGNIWTAESVASILKNTVYYGEVEYTLESKIQPSTKTNGVFSRKVLSSTIIKCPAIISKETFDRAMESRQQRIARSASKISKPYLLKHLIRCPDCGNFLTNACYKNEFRYRCARKYKIRNGVVCKSPSVDGANLESIIFDVIKYLCNDILVADRKEKNKEPLLQKIEQFKNQLSGIDNMIEELEKKISAISGTAVDIKINTPNITSVYDNLINQISEVDRNIGRYKKERDKIETEIKKIDKQVESIDTVQSIDINNLDFDAKYSVFHKLIEVIRFYGCGQSILIVMHLTTGQEIYIGYFYFKQYYTMSYRSTDFYFDEENRTGIIRSFQNKSSLKNFDFKTKVTEYSIEDFLDSFNTAEFRMVIPIRKKERME